MRRRKIKVGSIQPAVEVAVGVLAAKVINDQALSKVDFIQQNPLVGGVAKVAIGVYGSVSMKNKTVKNISSGVAVDGILDVYNHFAAPATNGLPTVRSIAGRSFLIPNDRGYDKNHVAGRRAVMADMPENLVD